MSKEHVPPEWSASPQHNFSLEVLKEGVIVANIDLGEKAFYIAGRQPDVCDVGMEHPSISRQHAVFQHGPQGLTLYDMGSAQGTFLNKRQIPARTYERVFVGDVIKFGASTRLYVVCGPEELRPDEYESDNTRRVRRELVQRTERIARQQVEGATWGFGEDAEDEGFSDEDEEAGPAAAIPEYMRHDENYERKYGRKFESRIKDEAEGSVEGAGVSEKDRGLVEKIRKKERKVQNMQEENRRIYLKETGQENGLTEGQLAAVQRNDARIQVLMEEIEVLENEYLGKQTVRSSQAAAAGKGGEGGEGKKPARAIEDDDDMLDTTRETADSSTNWRLKRKLGSAAGRGQESGHRAVTAAAAVTYEELCALKTEQDRAVADLRARLADVQRDLDAFAAKYAGGVDGEGVDRMEYVLDTTRGEEQGREARQLSEQLARAAAAASSYEKLMRVAAPAIPSLSKPVAEAPQLPQTTVEPIKEVSTVAGSIKGEEKPSGLAGLTRPQRSLQGLAAFMAFAQEGSAEHANEEGGDHGVGDSEVRIGTVGAVDKSSRPLQHEQRNSADKRARKKSRVVGPAFPNPASDTAVQRKSGALLEGGEFVWVRPTGQTGDGRTALNEKLGY